MAKRFIQKSKGLACGAFVAGIFYFVPAVAVDNIPDSNELEYDIERKGSVIGRHHVEFVEQPDGSRIVDIKAKIRVKLAFITVFKLDHKSTEVWQANDLYRMESYTKKNSQEAEVAVIPDGDKLKVKTPEGEFEAPENMVPTSFTDPELWSEEGERDLVLLDTLSGLSKPSVLKAHGRQQLEVDGVVQDVRYFTIIDTTKDTLSHEFWIDDAGNMIKCHFITKDGDSLYYLPT